ncbi:MAG TPA: DUF1699 family protein [archaeon]|nr:DUF1699 family protein [archaeon]HPC10363.1 DUF1699 family protein [archaeon]
MLYKDVLNNQNKINKLDRNCETLHVTKPFSKKTFVNIFAHCKHLKTITLSLSTKERLSKPVKDYLKSKHVLLQVKKTQGRPIGVPLVKLEKILSMYKDYSYRELSEKLGVPKSTIHYIIKKAKKQKIKDDNKIVYLK